MQKKRQGLYHALVILPDVLYPFKSKVKGRWVRGIRSYNATFERYEKKYGMGHYGVKLDAYRQLFHLAGSILFLVVAAFLSHTFFTSTVALYLFLGIAVLFITFQEFYLHRRMYRQLLGKSFIDWFTWCAPMGIYFWMFLQ